MIEFPIEFNYWYLFFLIGKIWSIKSTEILRFFRCFRVRDSAEASAEASVKVAEASVSAESPFRVFRSFTRWSVYFDFKDLSCQGPHLELLYWRIRNYSFCFMQCHVFKRDDVFDTDLPFVSELCVCLYLYLYFYL